MSKKKGAASSRNAMLCSFEPVKYCMAAPRLSGSTRRRSTWKPPRSWTRNIPVRSGNNPEAISDNDEIVTQIIPIRFVEARQLVSDLSSFVSPQGSTAIVAGTATTLFRAQSGGWSELASEFSIQAGQRWRFAQFGGVAIATNGADPMQKIDLEAMTVTVLGGLGPVTEGLAIFLIGMVALVFTTLVHAIVLTYFMGTGRWLEETCRAYHLRDEHQARSRDLNTVRIT